jgi:hypothetical protein
MQKFMTVKKIFFICYLFLSIANTSIIAMNSAINEKNVPPEGSATAWRLKHGEYITPTKMVNLFDPETEFNNNRPLHKIIPKSIELTPDCKGVILGYDGKVGYMPFDNKKNDDLQTIIRHPHAKYCPMISVAQRKDGELLIASAVNYMHKEKKELVAEYILSDIAHRFSKIQDCDLPIQAMVLDALGEYLFYAHRTTITALDIASGTIKKGFLKTYSTKGSSIIDIAVNRVNNQIIVAGSDHTIQLMSMAKYGDAIEIYASVTIPENDFVTELYYPCSEEIMYITDEGHVKIMNVYDLLNTEVGCVKTELFSSMTALYAWITAAKKDSLVTANWSCSTKTSNDYHKIKMCCKEKDTIEKFNLYFPYQKKRYTYITEFGNHATSNPHLWLVALRGKNVIALTTDGRMGVWLVEDSATQESEEKDAIRFQDTIVSSRRSRSGSSNSSDSLHKKKTSTPFMQVMRKSRDIKDILSNDNSPGKSQTSSRELSPVTTPRGRSKERGEKNKDKDKDKI